ncbi:hypothetical protein OA328_02190 [Paracoccaceae bacterium]|nr:hypothetical protein [Paracoccaceae bacterium]
MANGRAINCVIEYDGSLPNLCFQNTYSLFIETQIGPEGLDGFFDKPDCDCTENYQKYSV